MGIAKCFEADSGGLYFKFYVLSFYVSYCSVGIIFNQVCFNFFLFPGAIFVPVDSNAFSILPFSHSSYLSQL